METILLAPVVIIILIAIWGICNIVFQSSKMDEEVERMLLRKEIDEKYPNMRRSSALNLLYEETIRKIITERKQGNATDDLEDKLWLILNERNAEISNEIEQESNYLKKN